MNCIIVDGDKKARQNIELLSKEMNSLAVLKSCGTLEEARDALSNNKVDIIFMDLSVRDAGTLDFINFLPYERPHLIVVSSQNDAAKDAFDLDATDFILKPVSRARFAKAVLKAMNVNPGADSRLDGSQLFIKENHRLINIQTDKIYLVEALADYVNIYTTDKRYTVHSTLKGILDKLPPNDFMRIHKSYIVRIAAITQVEDNTLLIESKHVPVSNTYKKLLMEKLKVV